MEGRTSGGGLKQPGKKQKKEEDLTFQPKQTEKYYRGAPHMSGQIIQNYSQPNAFLDPDFLRLLGDQAPLFAADLAASNSPTYQNGPISPQMQNARIGNAFTAMKERLLHPRKSNNFSSGDTPSAARGVKLGANDSYIQEAIQRAREDRTSKVDERERRFSLAQAIKDSRYANRERELALEAQKKALTNYEKNQYYELLKNVINVSKPSGVEAFKQILNGSKYR